MYLFTLIQFIIFYVFKKNLSFRMKISNGYNSISNRPISYLGFCVHYWACIFFAAQWQEEKNLKIWQNVQLLDA